MYQDIQITTNDDIRLNASCFEPINSNDCVIVIISAMAVHRHLYKKFALSMAEEGYTVITFDYRGTHGDTQCSPKSITLRDWGNHDAASVISWAKSHFSPKKLFVVSQSVGGQLVGLMPNNNQIDAMIAVTSQSGFWGHWSGREKVLVWLLWHIFIPFFGTLLPVFPGKFFGLGENIPSGVAKQWARWGRHPDYITSDKGPKYFEQFKAPILFYSFSDDALLGPKNAVEPLIGFYKNASSTDWRHISPGELGVSQIGHFGFFKEQSRENLWQDSAKWLAEQ